jgi:hypothetical protein
MNPTSRLLHVSSDVTGTMSDNGLDASDISKKWGPDLGMNLGDFEILLNKIQKTINKDDHLPQARKLNWTKIPGHPETDETFSQYYLRQSINELIVALNWVMSHAPYYLV